MFLFNGCMARGTRFGGSRGPESSGPRDLGTDGVDGVDGTPKAPFTTLLLVPQNLSQTLTNPIFHCGLPIADQLRGIWVRPWHLVQSPEVWDPGRCCHPPSDPSSNGVPWGEPSGGPRVASGGP